MATTYSELKTEIADFYNRTDLTSKIDTFIDFCEADMQVECKTLDFETDSTLTVTGGIATIPTGFTDARSFVSQSNPKRTLRYLPPDRLEAANANNSSGLATYYTITGSSIKFADDITGSVVVTYMAKFTPLSDSNPSNAILASHPMAYLYGSLKHAAIYCKDTTGASGYDTLFKEQLRLINKNSNDRKYAGQLEVRPA